jgi:hypothetical protein
LITISLLDSGVDIIEMIEKAKAKENAKGPNGV